MEKNKAHWIWMPHGGHFILASRCSFRLNTYVNGYIVSTVGELSRERLWDPKNTIIENYDLLEVEEKFKGHLKDFETIGFQRFYETMVFKAELCEHGWQCCPYDAIISKDFASEGYNDPVSATEGHIKWCHECDKENPDFPRDDEDEASEPG